MSNTLFVSQSVNTIVDVDVKNDVCIVHMFYLQAHNTHFLLYNDTYHGL
jgi:hypothetical protein